MAFATRKLIFVLNSTYGKCSNWLWKKGYTGETVRPYFLRGYKLKYKNSMHTTLGIKINNIHATNYKNRSRRLAVSVREITFGTLHLNLSPRFARSMMKQSAEEEVNKICVLRCL